jgi:hypothetical protein
LPNSALDHGMINLKANTWLILCGRCGKLKPQYLYNDIKRRRTCSECAEKSVEVTDDLVKHVQTIFSKTKIKK